MYSVTYDEAMGLVRMTVEGFWDVEMVNAWAADVRPVLLRARTHSGRALVLSDARNFPVQSSEVGEAFAATEQQLSHLRDKLAMVVGSTLAKMQGQRAVSGSAPGFFATIEEAEQWLLKG